MWFHTNHTGLMNNFGHIPHPDPRKFPFRSRSVRSPFFLVILDIRGRRMVLDKGRHILWRLISSENPFWLPRYSQDVSLAVTFDLHRMRRYGFQVSFAHINQGRSQGGGGARGPWPPPERKNKRKYYNKSEKIKNKLALTQKTVGQIWGAFGFW